ncbi:F0F1 ATP synthase subunit B [Mycolicibacterium fluoranthenivorans]|uniref:ATP synthase subunit b n=1 Tax=Mycolicibacterium fluoranthenivorans TaxID=258505 RepID=A0A7X5U4S6_9MYCO|nr:F0F1 ATP synthase subunit B [Mycolicibacterium fluoranthenivorans]MCV7355921.1 F0F1 ATP synthase subunit B [Mycolicibacterium fluoranthenivorans]NIH98391.1 F-type H+-transporting ATPase subunit b [Mycolicibacterium fluoranthenivorans]
MGELATTVLTDGINILASSQAAEEGGGGQSNFLLPNGTFFAVLIIFLITLGVIWKWVVPPVSKVLAEREAMLAKTAADSRKSAEQVAAAQADYDQAMAGARTEASAIRDEARSAGREVVDAKRAEASGEIAETLRQANERLSQQGSATQSELASSVDGLSATLASRILGVDVKSGRNK